MNREKEIACRQACGLSQSQECDREQFPNILLRVNKLERPIKLFVKVMMCN
ncbi:hypothetical protein ALTERO38_52065 [Alteromonas sp. 38]|nr:hypothetical protein ALTER154_50161 [Alteromonas sp. 154]VXB97591.1 hypothetical protein ALTERO38_52065 [Alteromonas sp. 38]